MCPHWILFHPDISPLAVRLYLVLRQHADARGDSFPSRRRLADLLNVSLPTLDKARAALVDTGALTMDRRKGAGDEWLSCTYRIHWEQQDVAGGKESCPPLVKKVTPPSQESYALTHTQLTQTRDLVDPSSSRGSNTTEPSDETTGSNVTGGDLVPATPRQAASGRDSASFERFWMAYPRRVGKKAAYSAWIKAVSEADPETIIDGATRYANDPNRDPAYTAHPSTWLRAGRWEDEDLPARPVRQSTGGERRMDAYADLANRIGRRGITA